MVSITTKEVETIDGVFFYELKTSKFRDTPARVRRTKTLDGGCVIDHRGFSDGDRKFDIKAFLDEDTADDLDNIYRNQTIVNISCREGFFEGAISRMSVDNGDLNMTFLVK